MMSLQKKKQKNKNKKNERKDGKKKTNDLKLKPSNEREEKKKVDPTDNYREMQITCNDKYNSGTDEIADKVAENNAVDGLGAKNGELGCFVNDPVSLQIKTEDQSDFDYKDLPERHFLSQFCDEDTYSKQNGMLQSNERLLLEHNYCLTDVAGIMKGTVDNWLFENTFKTNEQMTLDKSDSQTKHISAVGFPDEDIPVKRRISIEVDCAHVNPDKLVPERPQGLEIISSNESDRGRKSSEAVCSVISPTKNTFLTDPAVTLDEIAKEINEMEKIIQSKCEILYESEKRSGDDAKVKAADAKPKKSGKEDEGDWNLEYTEDDVKNLGLDDLLLRASELNAENFTKALGQNSGANSGKTDGSEFILTFPDAISKDGDGPKAKKTKLDFYKKYVKENKATKPDAEPQNAVEPSPKCTGLKVKTVQNINEEFNDSLKKSLDEEKNDGRDKGMKTKSKDGNEDGKDRPVVMTIIQNKDDAAGHFPRVPEVAMAEECLSKTGDENVTLLVAEPGPFEVVNVKQYRNGSKAAGEKTVKRAFENGVIKKRIAFPIGKKLLRMPPVGKEVVVMTMDSPKKMPYRPQKRLVKLPSEGERKSEKNSFTVTSMEQKIMAREGAFIKLCPDQNRVGEGAGREDREKTGVEDGRMQMGPPVISLWMFSNILKDILPDKWILSLDRRYGLQIIKTHLDELLNPSIMISVVVGWKGKVTVNVRGRQLEKSHDLFANLCDVGNSHEKISINYILGIINKLRFFSVCFGCDDLSLKKYWSEDGFIEYYTEFQQTYRSHICESLVRLGKKRCYPCYRMHESLKKRRRRERMMKKTGGYPSEKATAGGKVGESCAQTQPARGMKRNLMEFLEESFINMKQKIEDEIERTKEDEESEKVPKTQEEVLSFMGLTRKDALDVNLRKSKRERKGFKKCESVIGGSVNKEELYFLEKYWTDINVLFSTSLLIGAYSRTSTGRLREKCRMFHKLLSTWRGIVRDNPDWVGGYINLAENLVDDDEPLNEESAKEKFDKMDVPALRAYIINCVKEVNKIKSRLRTKNNYFKVLYNTFVKPRMKKARQPSEEAKGADPGRDASKEAPGKAESGAKPGDAAAAENSDKDGEEALGGGGD